MLVAEVRTCDFRFQSHVMSPDLQTKQIVRLNYNCSSHRAARLVNLAPQFNVLRDSVTRSLRQLRHTRCQLTLVSEGDMLGWEKEESGLDFGDCVQFEPLLLCVRNP